VQRSELGGALPPLPPPGYATGQGGGTAHFGNRCFKPFTMHESFAKDENNLFVSPV